MGINHTYTKELILHFNCVKCMNWWSYATSWATTDAVWKKWPEMTCPHCGHKAEVELKK